MPCISRRSSRGSVDRNFESVDFDREKTSRSSRGSVDRNMSRARRNDARPSRSSRGSVDRNALCVRENNRSLSRSSRGSVDRNVWEGLGEIRQRVAPHAGAWIETLHGRIDRGEAVGRSSRGSVDRNAKYRNRPTIALGRSSRGSVDRNIAALHDDFVTHGSLLTRERGSKQEG